MARRELGPRQAAKHGNEQFDRSGRIAGYSDVAPEKAGRDTSDEEAGISGILRKGDGGGGGALRDNGHDRERDREYRAPSES
jgi:hypothetical protein